jgi:hypothetical protein
MRMTIQEVIDLIMREVPDRKVETVDTFKAGDPRATVRGIVTTFIATVGVLKRARTLKANLVITHEPTYFDHLDRAEGLAGDPVLAAKRKAGRSTGRPTPSAKACSAFRRSRCGRWRPCCGEGLARRRSEFAASRG